MAIDRDEWPVPDEIKGASGRDVFLWYICDGWGKFMGGDEPIETVLDHDAGHHILRRGDWELTLEYKGPSDAGGTVLWTGNTLADYSAPTPPAEGDSQQMTPDLTKVYYYRELENGDLQPVSAHGIEILPPIPGPNSKANPR